MSELLPCPLCGDNPYVSAEVQGYGPRVMCQNHNCSMDGSYNVDTWNQRHITLEQAKRVIEEAGMDNPHKSAFDMLINAIDNYYPDSPEFAELYVNAKELAAQKESGDD